jgi:hypothetical protein
VKAFFFFLPLVWLFPPFAGAPGAASPPEERGVQKSVRPSAFDSVKTDLSDYIWPTDASTKITSSFAEYRTTHFHGGIDISTNGQPGHKVFAVRDGWVQRIRIAANGYGKMLYLRHADGYYSTYAHLQGFNDTITSLARREQYRRESYAIDLELPPGAVPVHKGDVIAATGETGFGPPHLHFELRDENQNPVNPMLCTNFAMKDRIAPTIRRMMLTPLDPASTVENVQRSKILGRLPRRGLLKPIRIHGLIGLSIDAIDRSEGTWSKAGVHKLEFFVDDSLAFVKTLNRVPAEETKQIDLDYDFPTILHGWGKFQKLYIDTGNALPFYGGLPVGTGIVNTQRLAEGAHTYRIVCSDIHGNRSEVNGTLLANHNPVIAIDAVEALSITLSTDAAAALSTITVYGKRNAEADWHAHTLPASRFERTGSRIVLPVKTSAYDIIKVIAESPWGSKSAPAFRYLRKPVGSGREIHLETDVRNDFVIVTASATAPFTTLPVVTVQEGRTTRTLRLDARDLYTFTGSFVPDNAYAGRRLVRVDGEVNGHAAAAVKMIDMAPVPPGKAGFLRLFDGRMTVAFDSGAVFRSLYMQPSTDQVKNANIYVLEPQDVLLDGGLRVTLEGPEVRDHLGLYFRANGGWVFQTGTPDRGTSAFTATVTRTLGDFALLRDAEEPTIGRLSVTARRGVPRFGFRYHDNLSGVDTDEIKAYIDGALIIPEIDGEKRRVWYQGDHQLSRGRHTLRIALKDRMNNAAEFSRTFSVR